MTAASLGLSGECLRLRNALQLVSDQYCGPLDETARRNTSLPFVLLLGNHSSGKSSFINYVLNADIQQTGVAPTDDAFTIIGYGAEDDDRSGPTLVGDPDLGFSGLSIFGPNLVHRTQLKLRSKIAVRDFMIIDSPGMIDSPVESHPVVNQSSAIIQQRRMDRGYDFEGVCRWFAERADVILLFFDPDKPGTTGETLSILTNSLCQAGHDHKLHILLNKADQFHKIHDFARAYGSLCWNLSKVIHRKDMPIIHTMCIPPENRLGAKQQLQQQQDAQGDSEMQFINAGFYDLEASRREVVHEVFNAPKRRIDNDITRVTDAAHLLLVHCRVVEDTARHYRCVWWSIRPTLWLSATVSAASVAFAAVTMHKESKGVAHESLFDALAKAHTTRQMLSVFSTLPRWQYATVTAGVSMAITAVVARYQHYRLATLVDGLTSQSGLWATFTRVYAREIACRNQYILSNWDKCVERLRVVSAVTVEPLQALVRGKRGVSWMTWMFGTDPWANTLKKDMRQIETILDVDLANLRRQAAKSASVGESRTQTAATSGIKWSPQTTGSVATGSIKAFALLTPEVALTANLPPQPPAPQISVVLTENTEEHEGDDSNTSDTAGNPNCGAIDIHETIVLTDVVSV